MWPELIEEYLLILHLMFQLYAELMCGYTYSLILIAALEVFGFCYQFSAKMHILLINSISTLTVAIYILVR